MIKLIKSSFYEEAKTKIKLADFIKKSSSFSMGKECRKYEINFAKKQKRKYAVYVSSGSMANLVLLQALSNLNLLKKGDKIGFSALTWSTNVMPIIQLGFSPVALDCSLESLNVTPLEVQKNIKNIKALFITNALGFCDDIQKIKKICEKNKIIFLEDNCESLGSKANGKLLGNFGLASTFSFFVGHHLSTIEGGMVCTDDKQLYEMLIIVRAHGWDRNLNRSSQKKLQKKNKITNFYSKYIFYDLAYNARPTEINGLIGNQQIKYWDEIVKIRENNFKIFQKTIKNNNNNFFALDLRHMNLISNFAVPVICKTKKIFEQYKNKFIKAEVEIRPIIAGNITKQPFYKKYVKQISVCKNSDLIHANGFYFGNNPELTKKEINSICDLLK